MPPVSEQARRELQARLVEVRRLSDLGRLAIDERRAELDALTRQEVALQVLLGEEPGLRSQVALGVALDQAADLIRDIRQAEQFVVEPAIHRTDPFPRKVLTGVPHADFTPVDEGDRFAGPLY